MAVITPNNYILATLLIKTKLQITMLTHSRENKLYRDDKNTKTAKALLAVVQSKHASPGELRTVRSLCSPEILLSLSSVYLPSFKSLWLEEQS